MPTNGDRPPVTVLLLTFLVRALWGYTFGSVWYQMMSADNNIARVHIKVTGRVQGVYYRASTVQEAQNLGLTGWVMNCPDGSVEAVAEGAKPNLEALVAWCHQGPQGARVANVHTRWENAANNFLGFTIRR